MKPAELRRALEKFPTITLRSFTINGEEKPHRWKDKPRKVQSVRSKDFLIGPPEDLGTLAPTSGPSYMDLPKAAELTGDAHRFTITSDDSMPGRPWIVALTYELANP